MDEVGKSEWQTQKRVVRLFRDAMGYTYLGDWQEREGNSNIEQGIVRKKARRSRG